MSLHEISSLPPNNIVDKRTCDGSHYLKWLDQLTDRAVDKALQLQTKHGHQVDIVDAHRCCESRSIGCSNPFYILIKHQRSAARLPRALPSPHTRTWHLSKDSEDRRRIAAKIYAYLIEWRSDTSFEWSARVALAVPIIEDALYQEAKSKEEYTDPFLLDSHLQQILCHFEAGNGPFLLQGSPPLYPLKSPGSFCRKQGYSPEPSGGRAIVAYVPGQARQKSSRKKQANCALQGALASGSVCVMEEGLKRHGQFASKKIVRHVTDMILKKSKEESNLLKSMVQNIGGCADAVEVDGSTGHPLGSREARDEGFSPGLSSGNICKVRRSRTTLADMLRSSLSETESRGTLLPMDHPGEPSAVHENEHHMTMDLDESPEVPIIREREASEFLVSLMPPDSECNVAESCSIGESMLPEILIIEENTASSTSLDPAVAVDGESKIPLSSSTSSISNKASSVPLLACQPQSQPYLSVAIPQLVLASSFSSLSFSSLSTQEEEEYQEGTSSDTAETVEVQSCPNDTVQVTEAQALTGELVLASLTTHGEDENESGDSQSSDGDPFSVRDMGARVPLAIFLAERDDEVMSCSEVGPWDTWEEPTEQLDPLCCVCMVGLKGAAFIPCGHTFCRRCSRELWKGRGTCPLCNGYIRELLDIY